MAKKRVDEIARAQGVSSQRLIAALQRAGLNITAAKSTVDERTAAEALAAAAEHMEKEGGTGEKKDGHAGGDGKGSVAAGQRTARRRRVVIDSQASRRQPSTPAPAPIQRPRRGRRRGRTPFFDEPPAAAPEPVVVAEPEVVEIASGATVKDAAAAFGVPVPDVIRRLMGLGEMASVTQTLSDDAIELLAAEMDRKVTIRTSVEVSEEPEEVDREEDLVTRPPVVTVMGHVDHGKTSLLDAIRETAVVEREAGGITQHIGAYQVKHDGKDITFIDTPGHEAFTAMRARGAKVTDIATIVVAADDGVMPQTLEAIDHARAAGVPIMVAVNKIDKEGANPEKVRSEMAARGINPEEWGGETVFCDVSAKTGQGLDSLLEMVQLVADVADLKANPSVAASGTVIESRLDPGRGPVVTILVRRGTLRIGDALVVGQTWGKVKAMLDFRGRRVEEAEPGEPVEVLGLNSVPEAGQAAHVAENDRVARQRAGERAVRLRSEELARKRSHVSLEDLFERVQKGAIKELNIVLKGDVAGSIEVLEDEFAKIPQGQVRIAVIHTGVGGINESDVMLASASSAVIIGFNVRPFPEARDVARREDVEVRLYSVIYKVVEDIRAAMEGLLEPEEVEEDVGSAEIRKIFTSSRVGRIAGCHVVEGSVSRGAQARVVRDGTVVHDGTIASLRRGSDDATEVKSGFDCGIVLKDFADVKEGDVIETYSTKQVERQLD